MNSWICIWAPVSVFIMGFICIFQAEVECAVMFHWLICCVGTLAAQIISCSDLTLRDSSEPWLLILYHIVCSLLDFVITQLTFIVVVSSKHTEGCSSVNSKNCFPGNQEETSAKCWAAKQGGNTVGRFHVSVTSETFSNRFFVVNVPALNLTEPADVVSNQLTEAAVIARPLKVHQLQMRHVFSRTSFTKTFE